MLPRIISCMKGPSEICIRKWVFLGSVEQNGSSQDQWSKMGPHRISGAKWVLSGSVEQNGFSQDQCSRSSFHTRCGHLYRAAGVCEWSKMCGHLYRAFTSHASRACYPCLSHSLPLGALRPLRHRYRTRLALLWVALFRHRTLCSLA